MNLRPCLIPVLWACLAGAAHCAATTPDWWPRPAPGLWKAETTLRSARTVTTTQCIDTATQKAAEAEAQKQTQGCKPSVHQRNGNVFTSETVCGDTTTQVRLTVTDNQSYTSEVKSLTHGKPSVVVVQKQTRLGDCASAQSPDASLRVSPAK
ncbi:DUF3617 domain-containing protein [Acidovorax sp.]|uniref:DUF3617 domain-containing protein n=1 Tax=Acidovorax sp. TaxID=1872122 RepID=UPI003CFC17C1